MRQRLGRISKLGRALGLTSICLCSAGILSYLTRWCADALTLNASLYFHAIHPRDLLHLLQPGYSGWTKAVWEFIAAGILQASFLIWWSIALGVMVRNLRPRAKAIVAVLFCVLVFGSTWQTTTTTRLHNPEQFETVSREAVPTASFRLAFVLIPFFAALGRASSDVSQRRTRMYFCVVGALLLVQVHSELGLAVSAGRIAIDHSPALAASADLPAAYEWVLVVLVVLPAVLGLAEHGNE